MEEKAAIAKRFIAARKNFNEGLAPLDEEGFTAVYTQLITGCYGQVKTTGVGSELGIMINPFDSNTGSTRLFLFTPAKEDQYLKFEPVVPAPAANIKNKRKNPNSTISYGF